MKQAFFIMLGLLLSTSVWARKVDIPISHGQLILSNPTSQNVSYNLICKDRNGATALNETSQSLLAGKTREIGHTVGASSCSAGKSQNIVTGGLNGMSVCYDMMGSVYTSAASYCGTGFHVCSIQDVHNNKGTASSSSMWGYVQVPSAWSSRTWDGSNYVWQNNTSSSHYASMDSMGMQDYRCATGTSGSGTVITGCFTNPTTDPMTMSPAHISSVMCCSDIGSISHCQVDITSTSEDAYLISPQFMGGKAF